MFKKQGPLSNEEEGPQHFCAEYDPLEYLLISIIDAYPSDSASRKTRLRRAYLALTGKDREHVDEPDGNVLQAAWQITTREEINFNNQLKPEYRDASISQPSEEDNYQEKTMHKIIVEYMEATYDSSNLEDYLKQRYSGRYNNKRLRQEKEGFHLSMIDRYLSYRKDEEKELREDVETICMILAKYGYATDPQRPFWRLSE